MPLVIKVFLFSILFIIVNSLFTLQPAYAQTSTVSAVPSTVSPTSPLYTDLILNNMFHSFSCLAVGSSVIGQPCLTYQVTKNAQGVIQSVPILSHVNLSGGTLGAVSSLIAGLYANPPIRTTSYLASLGEGFGVVKNAHAQVTGSGSQVLDPIIKLWQVSRNIAYLIMIFIFIIIGIMVMFRNRINPQTVITVQAALPGLVIGLILITFSYFLSALISDLAFVGTNLVGFYFSAAQGTNSPNLVDKTNSDNVLSIFSRFLGIITVENASQSLESIWQNLGTYPQTLLRMIAGALAFQFGYSSGQIALLVPGIGQGIQAAIGILAGVTALGTPTGVLGFIIPFIATLTLIYSMLRLLLRLVNTFLNIIFLTISAPFHFLAASLPGRQGIATDWIRNMLCHVLAFPAVLFVFYFVAYILKTALPNESYPPFDITNSIPLSGTSAFPLLGGINLKFINILVAFGALVALPSIPDIICRTVGKVTQAGQLIGQEVGGGVSAGRGYSGQVQQGVGTLGERGGSLYSKSGLEPTYDDGGNFTGYRRSKLPIFGAQAGGVERVKSFGRTWADPPKRG